MLYVAVYKEDFIRENVSFAYFGVKIGDVDKPWAPCAHYAKLARNNYAIWSPYGMEKIVAFALKK